MVKWDNFYRKLASFGILIILMIFAATSSGWPYFQNKGNEKSDQKISKPINKKYRSDQIIVKFKEDRVPSHVSAILESKGVEISRKLEEVGVSILKVKNDFQTIEDSIKYLNGLPFVQYAEPDYEVQLDSTYPSDPLGSQLWGLHNTGQEGGKRDADIDAPEAWGLNTGCGNVVVAILDTGIDYYHEDLQANMWVNPLEIPGNGLDDDGNGYVDDIHGIDVHHGNGDPYDDHAMGHGTHVAGIIGAVGNNGIGVVGVNWNLKIMALKFIGGEDSGGSVSGAIESLDYILTMKSLYDVNVKVINCSWGIGVYSQALYDAMVRCQQEGLLIVAAAGNQYGSNNDENPIYPASYELDNIISVAASDRFDEMTSFSNYGPATVDLIAPGQDILSTIPTDRYELLSGTSMATAFVSGAAALIWSEYPYYDVSAVKGLIQNTVDPLSSAAGKVLSGGRLNINQALSCSPGSPVMKILAPAKGFTAYVGQEQTVSVLLSDCATPITGASVNVQLSNGDGSFLLFDDGIAPDAKPGDGIYTGIWKPGKTGVVTLEIFTSIGQQTIQNSLNGDVVEFPVYKYNDQFPYEWVDATSGTRLYLGDDDSISVPLGFDFKFYGIFYSSVRISSNGYLTFGSSGDNPINKPIPSVEVPNNLIAPFWDDLNPEDFGSIYYLLEGEAPNRRFIVEWHKVPRYPNIGAITFEVILSEASNDIVFQYRNVNFDSSRYDNGASATVGIESQDGRNGVSYSYNEAVLSNFMAIQFSYQDLMIRVENNESVFYLGDTIVSTATIYNGTGKPVRGDIYIALELPEGNFLFFDGKPNWFSAYEKPSASCVWIDSGYFVINYPVLKYTFPEDSVLGVYNWHAAILPCGGNFQDMSHWLAGNIESFMVLTP